MKLKYIDALRGIAILSVIVTHTQQYGQSLYNHNVNFVLSLGSKGVQLFFMASAFTLFLSYDFRKNKEEKHIKNFFIRRLFRIAPMYYIGIIYYLFQDGFGARYWLGDANSITLNNILANLLFVHGLNPYWITSLVPGGWSIAVEMMFYAFFPFMAYFIKSLKQAINFTIISILFAQILNYILLDNILISSLRLWKEYLIMYFPSQLPVFSLGVIAYFLIIKKDLKVSKTNLFLSVFLIASQFLFKQIISGHILISFIFLILFFILSKYEIRLLNNKMMRFIGRISYSGYLVHFAVLYWLNQLNFVDYFEIETLADSLINLFIRFIIVVLITTCLSYITYILIEKQFIKIGKMLIRKSK